VASFGESKKFANLYLITFCNVCLEKLKFHFKISLKLQSVLLSSKAWLGKEKSFNYQDIVFVSKCSKLFVTFKNEEGAYFNRLT
jgi:hypothetical protein